MNTKILYIAIAILFSLTGCKKKVETMSSVETNGVSITLNVDGGSRVIVDPDGIPYATVTFEENDIIYVGNNGAYCGYLEHDGTNFTGTVSPSSVDDYLHFYFMGNKGGTDSAPSSVSITDQTDHYPVIAYAHSTELFNPEVTSYTAKLQLYCALVKFITTDIPQATPITITGMNNTVGVNFEANCGATTGQPYSFSKSDNGKIKLHAESNTERWAILLPQDETSNAMAFINGTRYSTANAFTVPEITPNMFYNNDDIEVNLEQTYELLGEFTINDSGDKVAFSKGNLQYQASTDTWRFAENQLSVIGEDNQNISPTYSGWIDLFGWGTSGWDNGNWCYHPCSTYSISPSSSSSSSYAIHEARGFGYGPIDPDGYVYLSLTDDYANADWGVYNAISNGGNIPGLWRTLTKDEWVYLLNGRTTSSGLSCLHVKINETSGYIILPDNWDTSYYNLHSGYNTISQSDWETYLEPHGVVFLPFAGYREAKTVTMTMYKGRYWSSSHVWYPYKGCAYSLACGENGANPEYYSLSYRYMGFSVRLVQNLQTGF